MDTFLFHKNCTSRNHGTAGNRETGGFVNSAVSNNTFFAFSFRANEFYKFGTVKIPIYLFLSRTSLWSGCIPSDNRPVDLVLYQCRHGNNLSYVNWLESVCDRSPLPWSWQSLLVLVGTQQYHQECFGHTNTEILPENFEGIIVIFVQQTGRFEHVLIIKQISHVSLINLSSTYTGTSLWQTHLSAYPFSRSQNSVMAYSDKTSVGTGPGLIQCQSIGTGPSPHNLQCEVSTQYTVTHSSPFSVPFE